MAKILAILTLFCYIPPIVLGNISSKEGKEIVEFSLNNVENLQEGTYQSFYARSVLQKKYLEETTKIPRKSQYKTSVVWLDRDLHSKTYRTNSAHAKVFKKVPKKSTNVEIISSVGNLHQTSLSAYKQKQSSLLSKLNPKTSIHQMRQVHNNNKQSVEQRIGRRRRKATKDNTDQKSVLRKRQNQAINLPDKVSPSRALQTNKLFYDFPHNCLERSKRKANYLTSKNSDQPTGLCVKKLNHFLTLCKTSTYRIPVERLMEIWKFTRYIGHNVKRDAVNCLKLTYPDDLSSYSFQKLERPTSTLISSQGIPRSTIECLSRKELSRTTMSSKSKLFVTFKGKPTSTTNFPEREKMQFFNILKSLLQDSQSLSVILLKPTRNDFMDTMSIIVKYATRVLSLTVDIFVVDIQNDNVTSEKTILQENRHISTHQRSYIIYARSVQHIRTYFDSLYDSRKYVHPQFNYILLFKVSCIKYSEEITKKYEKLLNLIWIFYGILRAYVVESDKSMKSRIFSYYPFFRNNNSCWGKVIEYNNTLSFTLPSKKIKTLNGYPLNTYYYQSEGKDSSKSCVFMNYVGRNTLVFKSLRHYMQFSLNELPYSCRDLTDGDIRDSKKSSVLRYISERKAEILFNAWPMTYDPEGTTQYTSPYVMSDSYVVLYSANQQIPRWTVLFSCFPLELAIFFIACYIICSLFWYILDHFLCQHSRKLPIFTSFLDVLKLFWGVSWSKLNTTSVSQKCFVSSCMLLSLILVNLYQGLLIDCISNPSKHMDINTFEDLDNSGYAIISWKKQFLNAFEDNDIPVMRSLYNKHQYLSISKSNLIDFSHSAFIETETFSQLLVKHASKDSKRRSVNILSERLKSVYVSYVTPKNSPFMVRFEEILSALLETGILQYVQELIKRKNIRGIRKITSDNTFSINVTFFDLSILFMVFGLGSAIGILVFILEVYLSKRLRE